MLKSYLNIAALVSGFPSSFIIDEDAFETASRYLNTLTHHFGGSESAAEIMQDIESRMGELINRSKGTRTIVSTTSSP